MSKRSRDLGLCVGVRVACCGPPHPNRDREKDKGRLSAASGAGSGNEEKSSGGQQAQQQQLDLYGVITREGSAANGGWFEVQLDSQPDKKVYYRRGSICKLKQQPHAHNHQHNGHNHHHQQQQQQQQQQTTVAAVRAITHSAHPQQTIGGVIAAAVATPATLLSAPSSPPAFVLQHQPTHQQQQQQSQQQPSATLLLSPSMAHCGEGSAPPLLLQQCVTSPVARPVCTCSLGCTPLLPSTPLSYLSSASARRASTGSVEGALSLSLAGPPSAHSKGAAFSPVGTGACVELHSPPFAASCRSVSTPSRPLLLTGVASSCSRSSLSSGASDPSHPSAFTSVMSAASTTVIAPRAVRMGGSGMDRATLTPLLHPLSAPVLPLSVAVPAARRPAAAAAVPIAPVGQTRLLSGCAPVGGAAYDAAGVESAASLMCFDVGSKRRRLSLEDVEFPTLGSPAMSACSTTACLPANFVQPTLCHSVALCSL